MKPRKSRSKSRKRSQKRSQNRRRKTRGYRGGGDENSGSISEYQMKHLYPK
jgi:hypothetical protein